MKRKFFAWLINLFRNRKAILFLCVLPFPIGFLLYCFSMWLYLILFIGGYISLFLLALKIEECEKNNL